MAAVQTLCQFCRLRQYPTDAIQGIECSLDLTDGTVCIAIESIVCLIERTLDVLGMLHGLTLLFQFLLLASNKVGIGQLIILELQEVCVLTVTLNIIL